MIIRQFSLLLSIYFLISILTFSFLFFISGQEIIKLQSSSTPVAKLIPSPTLTQAPTPTITPIPTAISTRVPTLTPIPTINTSQNSTNLDFLFAKYAAIYNVDPNVLKKIAGCESGFNPNAVRDDYAGLFQFASFAWIEARERIGLPNDQNLRFNAEESIKTAAHEINYKGTSGWSDCDK